MSLLDVLGNYYDSAVSTIIKVPTEVQFDLKYKITGINDRGFACKITAHVSEKKYAIENSYYERPLLNLCNKIVPSFFVNNKIYFRNDLDARHEVFKMVARTPDGHAFTYSDTDKLDYKAPVADWVATLNSIPKEFIMSFTITRVNNEGLRKLVSLQATGGKHPKDYFAEICDSSFDNTRTHRSKYATQNAFPHGSIKNLIMRHRRKEEGVFLAEYLYGVKVPKSATYEEFFKRLANRPQTDFGVKDVQVLKRLMQICRSNIQPERTTQNLIEIGVSPATDLKRWYNKNPVLENIVATNQNLAQK